MEHAGLHARILAVPAATMGVPPLAVSHAAMTATQTAWAHAVDNVLV